MKWVRKAEQVAEPYGGVLVRVGGRCSWQQCEEVEGQMRAVGMEDRSRHEAGEMALQVRAVLAAGKEGGGGRGGHRGVHHPRAVGPI